eukprot:818606-Amphidinium_carterae.1
MKCSYRYCFRKKRQGNIFSFRYRYLTGQNLGGNAEAPQAADVAQDARRADVVTVDMSKRSGPTVTAPPSKARRQSEHT